MNDRVSRRSRIWIMRAMAVSLSLLPLLLLEAAMRFSEPPVAESVDHDPLVDLSELRPLFVLNESGDRWEIPPQRMNFFRPDSFLADKPAGTRRLFVLGGSTVQGRPYATETAMSTWLRLRLESSQPQTSFEVVNCGGVSYASYRVAKVLEEVLNHQPDAIVIYTGHNEFLEDREYAEVRSTGMLRSTISSVAGRIATVRWIRRKLHGETVDRSSMAGEVNARLDHAGGLERYRRDANWRRGVEQHFELTLRRMVDRVQSAGVPLVLCVPASDLVRTPPFKVDPPDDLPPASLERLQSHYEAARDVEAAVDARIQSARECLAIDADHAGAHYIVGRLLYEQGQTAAARQHLIAARDNDVCPLRATTSIMQSVVQLAAETNTPLIQTDQLLDQRDWQGQRLADGIPDPVFFVDHVHPSVGGHQRIGGAIVDALVQVGWVEPGDSQAAQRYQLSVEQHLAGLGEEYYARGKQRLEGLRLWAAGRAGQSTQNQMGRTVLDPAGQSAQQPTEQESTGPDATDR